MWGGLSSEQNEARSASSAPQAPSASDESTCSSEPVGRGLHSQAGRGSSPTPQAGACPGAWRSRHPSHCAQPSPFFPSATRPAAKSALARRRRAQELSRVCSKPKEVWEHASRFFPAPPSLGCRASSRFSPVPSAALEGAAPAPLDFPSNRSNRSRWSLSLESTWS